MTFKKFDNRIWLSTPTMHNEEQAFVNEAFETNWIAPLGPHVDAFEKEVAAYAGLNHAAALSSGTAALHLAYKLAEIGPGDIVLVSDLTFSATVNPIIYEQATPVLIDSERESWNMDPRALELALEKYKGKVKAVIVVHLYGTPAKMDEIMAICEKYQVLLIEDAAESMSASYKGKQTGSFGKYGIFSFNGNKIITSSGGGMLVSNDELGIKKARFWSTQARDNAPWYQHSEIGYNYRMSNVVAGIGRGQLIHLDEHRELKRAIYKRYEEGFKDLPVTMNPMPENVYGNAWISCLLIDKEVYESGKVTPEKIADTLASYNVETRPIWKPMHMQPIFESYDYISYDNEDVGKDIFARGICLPSDIKMAEEEQAIVIDMIYSLFE